jgi:hypothetical protein
MAINGDGEVDRDPIYDQFPDGASAGYGPEQGYNTIVRLNDPQLFTEEAREQPAIRAFLEAPFSVSYVQFKSSHREGEYFVHKPDRVFAGAIEGIEGLVDGFPEEEPRISTLVLNHERTLARSIMRAMIVEDGAQAGQIIHKESASS